jgi:hypothetical protein
LTCRFVDTAFHTAGRANGHFFAERVGERLDRMRTVHLKAVQVKVAMEFDERLAAVRS